MIVDISNINTLSASFEQNQGLTRVPIYPVGHPGFRALIQKTGSL